MNKADEIRSWPTNETGWYVSPGASWCAAGNRVKLGNGVTLGNRVKLGNGVTLGNWVKLGDGVKLGNWVKLVTGTTYAKDLGVQSGYRHALTVVNGKLRFVGGCHTFSFAEAREYWAGKPDRVETLAAVDFAEKLAALIPECVELLP